MLPITSHSFILGVRKQYEEFVNDQAYIVVTQHNILFKRIRKEEDSIILISDNSFFPPQQVKADEVLQYWKALKAIIDIPSRATLSVYDMQETLQDTNEKVNMVLNRLGSLTPGQYK